MSYNLTGLTASFTYGRLVQVIHGATDSYYDGFGNLLNLGSETSTGPQGPTGPQGLSINWMGEWDSMMMYFYYDLITYNGVAYICISTLTGSAPWDSPDIDTTHWQKMLIGSTGTSGSSGTSATSGSSGTSATSGSSGSSGTSATSGSSGSSGTSATSGSSGVQGPQGISAGRIYYFNMTATASVNGYRSLSTTPLPNGGTYSIETLTGNELGHLVETFMTEPLGFSIIPGGVQRFHLHFLKGAVGHDIESYVSIRLTDSVGVPIGPTLSTNKQYIGWNDSTTNVEVLTDLTLPTTGIDPTNRMLVNIYLDNKDSNSRTVEFHTEGTSDYSYVITSVGVVDGTPGVNGTSGTSGQTGTSGSSGVNGAGGSLGYYGSFYDTSTQLNLTASLAMPMYINSIYEANGVSLSNGSKMVFSRSGTYNIQFSTVFNKSNSASGLVDIWFSKNGQYITQSNTSFNIAGQSTTIASWNFINTVESNDYIQLYWSSPDTAISIVPTGTQSTPNRPAVPSIILTTQQVMYTQLGATGSSGTSGSSGSSGTSGPQGDKGGLQYQLYDISGGTPITGKFTMYSSEGTWFDLRINVTDRLGNNNSGYFSQLVGSNGYIYITNNSNSIARATVYPFTNVTLVSGYYLFGLDFASGIETDLLLNDICALTIVINGVNGSSGTTGTSGSSGLLSLLGSTNNGVITLDGSKPNATVESNLTFDGNTLLVSGTVSTDKLKVNTGYSNGYIMTSDSNGNANWQNYGTAKEENYYFSISNTTDIRPIYSDSNVTFNWDETANQLEMVMNIAPSGSGDMRSLAYIVGGSTQNTFIVSTGVIYDLYAIGVAAGNRLEVFVTAENDINYPAYHITVYNTGESFQNIVWIKKIYKI
ncbi:MAG: hypothetical protein K9G65_04120 [Rickettsiaceae bacterium]|nr:hypothetical protein [Rickettsiaceae bacterium]